MNQATRNALIERIADYGTARAQRGPGDIPVEASAILGEIVGMLDALPVVDRGKWDAALTAMQHVGGNPHYWMARHRLLSAGVRELTGVKMLSEPRTAPFTAPNVAAPDPTYVTELEGAYDVLRDQVVALRRLSGMSDEAAAGSIPPAWKIARDAAKREAGQA